MRGVNHERARPLFEEPAGGLYAGVVLNRPVDAVLSYRIPESLVAKVRPGARVRVPLGRANSPVVGYCVQTSPLGPPGVDEGRIKDLQSVLDDPPLIDARMLELTRWMARYYACAWGQALDAVVPAGVKNAAGTALRTYLIVPDDVKWASTFPDVPEKQAEALHVLIRSGVPLTIADVCRMARCGPGVVQSLRAAGLVRTIRQRVGKEPVEDAAAPEGEGSDGSGGHPRVLELTSEQRAALDRLAPALEGAEFAVFLLHGVTGSGKTEVYLSAIESVVARGREAIVLVPEISLTPQTIRRFRRRFARVAVLHSHMSDAERHRHWRSIAAGEVEVVVGARSAVFAPTRRLGLIVIDEEHETTFKQETVPRYHARDVAVKRAQLVGIPVILGSATPSLESWNNAIGGRYTRIPLTRRVGGRPMPEVELIDLRNEKPQPGMAMGSLSSVLVRAMREALDNDGQVLLLLNRRGYHTFILCSNCGVVCKCDACDVALTHHRSRQSAMCHTCDAALPEPTACRACGNPKLVFGGVGTERLERDVKSAFPDRIVRRMDSDTMRIPGSHERVLEAFRAGQVEILLGTQMIAKGLDFPDVTLVGVINADTALHLPDFRAAERTFQLVAQVAGRTGRGDKPGRVLVQTYSPDEPAICCAARHDYEAFVSQELPRRLERGIPPFGRQVRLIARGPVEADVGSYLDRLSEAIRSACAPGVLILGPAPAPVAKIRNLYRFHMQLRAATHQPLQRIVHEVVAECGSNPGIELAIDVDPVNML